MTAGLHRDGAAPPAARRLRAPGPAARADALVALGYLAGAIFLTCRLWVDPRLRVQSANVQDQIFFEWVLAHAARAVAHAENPFFTTALNSPSGVNLMANTSVLGVGVPLAPVTLLFGPHVTYVLLLTLGLAGTAVAWYAVLSRHVVRSRLAAAVGAGFCGFGPPIVSHANGHPNIVAQFLVPFIVWRVIRLREEGNLVRNAVVLGLLITFQFFVNEEILLFTALATGSFVAVYGAQRRAEVRPLIRRYAAGLALAGLVAGAACAYPLWVQFFGPQHYRGVAHWFDLRSDLSSYGAFARSSLAMRGKDSAVWTHPAEENAMLGWPLLLLLLAIVVWLRSKVLVRSVAAVGVLFAALSLGPSVTMGGRPTGVPGPWALFDELPVVEVVVAARFGLVTVPAVGILLASGLDEVHRLLRRDAARRWPVRVAALAAFGGALAPILPVPLLAQHRDAAPAFVTDGLWRAYLAPGETLVPVPLPTHPEPTGMSWSAQAGVAFPIPGGYFLGPVDGTAGSTGDLAPPARPTAALLAEVERSGAAALVTDLDRRRANEDLAHWNAGVVVLDVQDRAAAPLRQTLDALLGPGARVEDVWAWDV